MRFETDSSFYFDFFLAQKLGCTVEEMKHRVSAKEWREWNVYYGRIAQQNEMASMRGR